MTVEMTIEYNRKEMTELFLADAQVRFPAPEGYQYRVRHIFMERAILELEAIPAEQPEEQAELAEVQ